MDLNSLEVHAMAREPDGEAATPREGYARHRWTMHAGPTMPSYVHGRNERAFPREVIARGLPFPDDSIESIISHHCLEHIGSGFVELVDEIYRALKPDGILRAITPLFPSRTSVEDPTHCRMFMEGTWDAFCGTPDNHWAESFSVPYTTARFEMLDKDITPALPVEDQWGPDDAREIRVALRACK
jgi:SAM-dependent methyltransferase